MPFVLAAGDRGSGKSTLLRRWQGQDPMSAPPSTVGELALSYAYINVTEEGDDGTRQCARAAP